MSKLNELNTTKALVEKVLKEVPSTRDSDSLLYLNVIQNVAKEYNIRLENMSITTYLLNLSTSPFPCFESVRRCRCKLQAENSDLASSEKVADAKSQNEFAYKEFALT